MTSTRKQEVELDVANWDALDDQQRELLFFRMEPDAAYQWLLDSRSECESYKRLLGEMREMLEHAIAGWQSASSALEKRDDDLHQLRNRIDALDRSRSALDQKAAAAANQKRSRDVETRVEAFVRKRVKENQLLTAKQIAVEIDGAGWAIRNKDGDRLAFTVLLRKVGRFVTKAKADHRRDAL